MQVTCGCGAVLQAANAGGLVRCDRCGATVSAGGGVALDLGEATIAGPAEGTPATPASPAPVQAPAAPRPAAAPPPPPTHDDGDMTIMDAVAPAPAAAPPPVHPAAGPPPVALPQPPTERVAPPPAAMPDLGDATIAGPPAPNLGQAPAPVVAAADGDVGVSKVGQLLIEGGHASQDQVVAAIMKQRNGDRRQLGEILVDMGAIDGRVLLEVLGTQQTQKAVPVASAHSQTMAEAPVVDQHAAQAAELGMQTRSPEGQAFRNFARHLMSPEAIAASRTDEQYTLGEQIAKGGMGRILLAEDRYLRREVVMKLMLPGLQRDEERLRRFIEEAQVTGQLPHPNIVPVHELGVTKTGQVYFTMKRVSGEDGKAIVKNLRNEVPEYVEKYGLVQRLNIFIACCNAVGFGHSRGVVHRDLKPENIMIGEFGEVLVMDWGLAKVKGQKERVVSELVSSDRADASGNRTMDGAVFGTPKYMPPEQAKGLISEIDDRSDIYSLGAMLYEFLCLHAPFGGDSKSVFELLLKVGEGDFNPPGSQPEHAPVPKELEAVVMKAMAFYKHDRYQSTGELVEDIVAFLEGRTLSAAEYTLGELAMKWVRRHKAAVAGAAAAVVVVAATVGYFSWKSYENRQRVKNLLAEAEQLEASGDKEKAVQKLVVVLEKDDRNFDALNRKIKLEGEIKLAKLRKEQEREAAEKKKQRERDAKIKGWLAEAANQEKDDTIESLNNALQTLGQVMGLDPKNYDADKARDRIAARIKKIEQAAADRAAAERKTKIDRKFTSASQLEASGRLEDLQAALQELAGVLTLDPRNFDAIARMNKLKARIARVEAEQLVTKAKPSVDAGDASLKTAREAQAAAETARKARQAAILAGRRQEALTLLASVEAAWGKARDALVVAQTEYNKSLVILDNARVRDHLLEIQFRQFRAAEGLGETALASLYAKLVKAGDTQGTYRDKLVAKSDVALTLKHPATITLNRVVVGPQGYRTLKQVHQAQGTALRRQGLLAGDYMLAIAPTQPRYLKFNLPFRLERDLPVSLSPYMPLALAAPPGMVYVPAGVVTIGGDLQAFQALPREEVFVKACWISKLEVTFKLYGEYILAMGGAAHTIPKLRGRELIGLIRGGLVFGGRGWSWQMPAITLTHQQVIGYVQWLARTQRRPYRLPTELEWEKAARGADARIFPWGDVYHVGDAIVAVPGKTASLRDVGSAPRDLSPYGALDMAGNAEEWTATRVNGQIVSRGGAYQSLPNLARSARRNFSGNQVAIPYVGFRLAMDVDER